MKNTLLILLSLVLLTTCQNDNVQSSEKNSSISSISVVEFKSPMNGSNVKLGDNVTFELLSVNDSVSADSIQLSVDGKLANVLKNNTLQWTWETKNTRLGKVKIGAKVFASKAVAKNEEIVINVLSDVTPKEYSYKIIKTYPHSRESYTQGLIYRNGIFYESAGQYGKSALKKVKLETGEISIMVANESNIFAEGIALKGNEIYQISWRERVCNVYDKDAFKQLRKFSYDIEEGWGLEFDGKQFLMTDGSNTVYFLDSESFTTTSKIEVMDNNGPVDRLNELELIKGKLFANVYTTDRVVIIDVATGKVLGNIDFNGLLSASDKRPDTDVLNGIAYNENNGHLYITGKNWPKLFEVELVENK